MKRHAFQKQTKLMHFSGHPGGLTLGTYGGIARDLLSFEANFLLGTGALDRFCTSEAGNSGTPGICNVAAILKMKDNPRSQTANETDENVWYFCEKEEHG